MKYAACIMALLLFSSLFIEICVSDIEQNACASTEYSGVMNDEGAELCGPFCVCAGCTLSVIIPQKAIDTFALRSYTRYLSPLSEGAPVEIAIPFWQPPKLS